MPCHALHAMPCTMPWVGGPLHDIGESSYLMDTGVCSYRTYLQKRGDLNVEVGAWVSRDASDTYSGDVFKCVRDLTYERNRAGEETD